MKNLKTKVILSGIVLVFALIATIGSTFAWFTVAQSVEVQSMELNVQAADSMLVRVAETNETGDETYLKQPSEYSTTITNQDFIDAEFDFVNEGWTLQPVTAIASDYASVDVTNLNTMEVNDDNLTRDLAAVNTSTDKNLAGGKYIELSLWILSQSTSTQEVVLQDLIINPVDDTSQSSLQDEIVYAVRMGVFEATDPQSPSDNIFGLDTDYGYAFTDPDSPGFFEDGVDPQGTADVESWKFNDLSNLSSNVTSTLDFTTMQNDLWYDSTNDTTTGSPINEGAATSTKTAADTIFTTPAANGDYTPVKVTFKIFVEGWDAQTTNDVISAGFEISFKFAYKNI